MAEGKQVPGDAPEMKQRVLEMGSAIMEKFAPIRNICDHLVGFHCYSDDIKRQVIAHHFCSMLNKDFRQCAIYDSDKKDAKLIGIEYVISEKLFQSLPEEEKIYWHSHVYEVKSGLLSSPYLPEVAEREVMNELITTYGKTIHTWQFDRDELPLGQPKVMMALMEDKHVDKDLLNKRDKLCGINTADIRKSRKDMKEPPENKMADQWYHLGKGITLDPRKLNFGESPLKF